MPTGRWRWSLSTVPDRDTRRGLGRGFEILLGGNAQPELTHLAVDLFLHLDTPLLWPWRGSWIAAVPWATDPIWNVSIELVAAAVFFLMVWKWLGK